MGAADPKPSLLGHDDTKHGGRVGILMVLPLRIELRTSPFPSECSTTELRQRSRS